MFRNLCLIFALCLASFGCSKNVHEQATRYYDDGRSKPIVALVPVFDRSGAKISWSLSEEFTDQLRQRFLKQSQFYINTPEQINAEIETLNETNNPFSRDYAWIGKAFGEEEFVVFAELVEHDIHPKATKKNFIDKLTPSCELSMTMRVRVFDLRGEKPEIVLQELFHQSHLIPKPSDLTEQSDDRWKKMSFSITPLGLAHSQFSKEIAKRIEDYILLSKSR
jgi:hypothetical protein